MTLEEKYTEWYNLYFDKFVTVGDPSEAGKNIPVEKIAADGSKSYVGDGTINLAELMQFICVCDLNGVELPITMDQCVETLWRLSKTAYNYFDSKFNFLGITEQQGFFMRDDLADVPTGALKALTTTDNEDPCYSPFISQDQVWNLNPILMAVAQVNESAKAFGLAINSYIKDNGYTIYNPYLSEIEHYFKYLPDSSLSLADRRTDRVDNYKPNIKVKRGANNWYYSGGTKACVDAFKGGFKAFSGTFRTFLYKCLVFGLDKLYEPLIGLFGGSFKHNAINCYAATSGIWYNKRFAKSRAKKTNKWLKKKGEFYNWNTDLLVGDHDTIDWGLVKEWLDNYAAPDTSTTVNSPIEFLCVYQWYNYHLNNS